MKDQKVLHKTIEKLQNLPEPELHEVNDFVDFLIGKIKNRNITYSIQQQASRSSTFAFLEEEEELYSEDDVEKYHQ